MSLPELSIRSVETERESQSCVDVRSRSFGSPIAPEQLPAATSAWLARQAAWRRHVPRLIYGAFRGETCVGCYQLDIRQLRIGQALVPVGCVGAVATHPDHRRQGVASRLLRHLQQVAREHGIALLLLHGIADFYHRLEYANVADTSSHTIDCAALPALGEGSCTVRPATPDDAPALHELYTRHYGRLSRSPDLQRFLLERAPPSTTTALALDRHDRALGYLQAAVAQGQPYVREVAADTWEAALALLHHSAALVGGQATLTWPLPLEGHTYYLLADRLPLLSENRSVPRADWMARVGAFDALMQTLAPAWRARWQRSRSAWSGALELGIGDEQVRLEFAPGALRMGESAAEPQALFSGECFVQVLCGYRPLSWVARQPGQHLPDALLPVLEVLLPLERLWMPASDEF
jgi:predicted N-acetyltransferase YhbS